MKTLKQNGAWYLDHAGIAFTIVFWGAVLVQVIVDVVYSA